MLERELQSVLDPHGPHAATTATLAWILFGGGALILVGVLVLAALAIAGPSGARELLGREGTILAAGAVFPVVVLSALLAYGLDRSAALARMSSALEIDVVGEQWWWRVRYLAADGVPEFETANEIRIPRGRPVELRLRSADVIHSFWVPNLAGKVDMVPGRVNRLRIQADRLGAFRGQCAEYCGGAHALMAFHVIAEEPSAFDAWRARQRAPAKEPEGEAVVRGRELFLASGCPLCHSVRGTGARGGFGPDLTHVGGRRTLAAGLLPNQVGTLAAWTASAHHLKPGSRMPSFATFPGEDLRALARYLEALE